MLQAIYSIDSAKDAESLCDADTGDHVQASMKHESGLVPLALLLLLSGEGENSLSVAKARAQLAETPVLRVLLERVLKHQRTSAVQ